MEKLEKNLEEKESVLAQKNNELIELKQQILQMSQQRELRERGDGVNVSKHIKILFTSNWVTINLALFKFFNINVFKIFGEIEASFLEKKKWKYTFENHVI